MKLQALYLFANGQVAAFDDDGNLVPELQRNSVIQLLAEQAVQLGYSVDGCRFCVPHDAGEAGPNGYLRVAEDKSIRLEWEE